MIKIDGLTKEYDGERVVNGLSIHVEKGEIYGFLGPNGAGKSTTMKILTGFMPATSGTAKVAGFDVFSQAIDVKRNVGYLPENPPVYMEMVVEDYLEFAAKLHDVESGKLRASISSAIERTGLTGVRKRIIGNLSKGYRQRVGLAQALVHNPQVLILDEPLAGLDASSQRGLLRVLANLRRTRGLTLVVISHVFVGLDGVCPRTIRLRNGVLEAVSTTAAAGGLA